jgi:hypothetical protein
MDNYKILEIPLLERIIIELRTEIIEQSEIIEGIKEKLNTISNIGQSDDISDYDDSKAESIEDKFECMINKMHSNTEYIQECLDHLNNIV